MKRQKPCKGSADLATQRLWQQLEKTFQWKLRTQKLNAKPILAQLLKHVFI